MQNVWQGPGKPYKCVICPLNLRWRKQVSLRHNAAPQQLLFEKLRGWRLADSVPPWYSRVGVKPWCEALEAKAYRDVQNFTFALEASLLGQMLDRKSVV